MTMHGRNVVILLILIIATVTAWQAVTAEPDGFIYAVEPGGRLRYMWWDSVGNHYLGEVRHTACIGGTLRIEHYTDTGYGWQFWQTYFVTSSSPEPEADDLPALERAGNTCILKVSSGGLWRKAAVREAFLPTFLDKAELQPAYPYP